jgi:hypothetical protein
MRRNAARSPFACRVLPACLGVAVAATMLATAPAAQALPHPQFGGPGLSCLEEASTPNTGYNDCIVVPTSGVAPYTYSWTLNSAPVAATSPGELGFTCSKGQTAHVSVTVTDSQGAASSYSVTTACRTGIPN